MVRMPKKGMAIFAPPRPAEDNPYRRSPAPVTEVDPDPSGERVDVDTLACPYCGGPTKDECAEGCPQFPIEIIEGAAQVPSHATSSPEAAQWLALHILPVLIPTATLTWSGKVRASGLSGCCLRSQREQWDAGARPAVGDWLVCETCRQRMTVATDGFLQAAA